MHDLTHTFGRRSRAVGVSLDDRQDLLGHRSGRIATDYSAAEIGALLEAVSRARERPSRKTPILQTLNEAYARNLCGESVLRVKSH